MRQELIVTEGVDKKKVFILQEGRNTVGREPGCTVQLADRTVSREHCELHMEGNDLWVKDLSSANGTFVNDCLVTEQILQPGDEVRVGDTTLVVGREPDSPVPSRKHKDIVSVGSDVQDDHTAVKLSLEEEESKYVVQEPAEPDVADLQTAARDLKLLYDLGSVINSIHTLPELLQRLINELMKILKPDRAFVMLVDEKTGRLKPRAVRTTEGAKEPRIVISKTIVDKVMSDGVSILSEDALDDSRFKDAASIVTQNIRSVMSAPLRVRDKLLGLIHVDSRKSVKQFGEHDLRLLSALANQVALAIEDVTLQERLKEENRMLHEALVIRHEIIGESAAINAVLDVIRRVAPTQSTVLVTGESGTGKELVAHAIHYNSTRKERPIICVNCAALTETLLESEIFGHERGAFTGAISLRKGRFEQADGGTIFLDEIGELSPGAQVKLLRVIEDGSFERVGGTDSMRVNVRVVAATNKDIEREIEAGRFREDLYYRLKVIHIHVPPLRERVEDILPLARHFIAHYLERVPSETRDISDAALRVLSSYSWPGNIRELRNVIERAMVLGKGGTIEPADISIPSAQPAAPTEGPSLAQFCKSSEKNFRDAKEELITEFERGFVEDALREQKGNVSEAARMVGLPRQSFQRYMRRYSLRSEDYR